MRAVNLWKKLTGVYLCVLCCFAYVTLVDAVPDHVYLAEGETLSLDQKLPVTLALADEQTVMADVGESTYRMLAERTAETGGSLTEGEHTLTCYLFGIVPVKDVQVSVVEKVQVYVSGRVVGIYGASSVLVMGTSPVEAADGTYQEPAENIVQAGDYITAVNGSPITEKEELIAAVSRYGDEEMVLTLWRGDRQIDVSVHAVEAADGGYLLGLWVKDDMAGIGTLTYYTEGGSFGALGHGIGSGQTDELLMLAQGRLYQAEVLSIKKGTRGDPGELQGVVHYGEEDRIGEIESNTQIGIYGTLTSAFLEKNSAEDTLCEIAYKQEVKTGSAWILSDVSGERTAYEIEIDDLDYSSDDSNKGIRFHVVDENLIALTGGIVQGLSGSPILQDGKLCGAVTHVLVSDPTQGYGVFIENMING